MAGLLYLICGIFFICSAGILAIQAFWYLELGIWHSMSLIEGYVLLFDQFPDLREWRGFEQILYATPIWVVSLALSFLLGYLGLVNDRQR